MVQDLGERLTNQKIKALDKHLQAIYSQAYKQAVENNQTWIEKLASLPEDASPTQRLAFFNEVKRTSGMIDQIAAQLAQTGEQAASIIQQNMNEIYRINYDYASYSISKDADLNLNFMMYDQNQIAVIVNSEMSPFSKIAYQQLGNDRVIVQRLGNALAVATINGESQRKLLKRIMDVTGQSINQARRVAQTERTRVQSQGRMMSINYAAQIGVGMQKEWIARMINTRDLHTATNHETVAYDQPFSNGLMFPADPSGSAENVINCHCVLKPKVNSVSEQLKSHREKFKYKTLDEYMKGER